ncbi:hypothetical protein [Amycolatopsis sp. 195334CR]|uniref:hypothetical protein n=1 Tax=Amycolatopsis sp. 195334CR TaxID=2814588 RepID=UPI001A8D5E5F|nr:hypothetical protein [Amycolatopsis sp. 195334CR]MBN6036541.1 hypothetical protein [Amycolatopsis sp. 195334CR]
MTSHTTAPTAGTVVNQQNHVYYGDFPGRRPRANHRQAARTYLQWLYRRYAYPRGYAEAQRTVAEPGTVLLGGAPGSGRQSAAKMLLYGLARTTTGFRELPDRSDGDEPLLDETQVEPGDRFLLDLSASDRPTFRSAQQHLVTALPLIAERGAHLLVVLPHNAFEDLVPELRDSVVTIGRPHARTAFFRHLKADGIEFEPDAVDEEIHEKLEIDSLERLARLVELVKAAREKNSELDFKSWLATAKKSWLKRDSDVALELGSITDGPARAAMLSVALLENGPADVVHHAANEILRITAHPEPPEPVLSRNALSTRLRGIRAEITDARTVRFLDLAKDEAVLRYFWDNFPDLRAKLTTWADRVVRLRELSDAGRREVAGKLAVQCLRTGRTADLRNLAEAWAGTYPEPAAQLLQQGLTDERWAGEFRQQLYYWSGKAMLPDPLAKVLIQLCVDTIAPRYPEQALVRLHRLARRKDSTRDAYALARDALKLLCEPDGRLFRRLLARLGHYPAENRRAADFSLFLEIANPVLVTRADRRTQPLLADQGVRRTLVRLWSDVLSRRKPSNWPDHVTAWLDEAGQNPLGAQLTEVLAVAASEVDGACSRMFGIAREWVRGAHADPVPARDTFTRFIEQIDQAQDFDPTAC